MITATDSKCKHKNKQTRKKNANEQRQRRETQIMVHRVPVIGCSICVGFLTNVVGHIVQRAKSRCASLCGSTQFVNLMKKTTFFYLIVSQSNRRNFAISNQITSE